MSRCAVNKSFCLYVMKAVTDSIPWSYMLLVSAQVLHNHKLLIRARTRIQSLLLCSESSNLSTIELSIFHNFLF